MTSQPPPEPADRYDRLLLLADLFDGSGSDLRSRAGLGERVLGDPAVADSADLSPTTYTRVDDEVRAATSGRHGLLARSVELDADALIVRSTVLTYRWIDALQDAAFRALGSIAGRAIGYLAPEVALGGAVVSAGLIETDALDRDGVAAFLEELAAQNPELMDHVAGGGGLLDGLRLRSMLTAGVLAGSTGPAAARGGLHAAGVEPFGTDVAAALRDVAGSVVGSVVERPPAAPVAGPTGAARPRGLEDLMTTLASASEPVTVHEVAPARFIVYLPGPYGGSNRRLRLVAGDHTTYADQAVRAIETAVCGVADARVMLVGGAQGGVTAVDLAAATSPAFAVDQVVTAGAPSALVPRVPEPTRVLSLEDRTDPVALLGSLVNAGSDNRLTVVFDTDPEGSHPYVAGGRAADAAGRPVLRAELDRIRGLGYLR